MRAVEGHPPPDPSAPKCPYPWIKEYAIQCLDEGLVKGNIQEFYDKWSENSKKCMNFVSFGRLIAQLQKINGKFTRVGRASEPEEREGAPGFWILRVEMFVDDIEFCVTISFNDKKNIGDFQFCRSCIYHTPSYIKEQLIERVTLFDSPKVLLSKPINTSSFPCALFVHTMIDKDIDIRMGYTFPGRDLEMLPCAKVGLIRGEYSPEMKQCPVPMIPFASKLMEQATMRDDISNIFFIFHSYSALFIGDIVRKFPGVISGAILVNPAWDAPEELGLKSLTDDRIPTDIPLLIIGSGFDQFVEPDQFKKWKKWADKHHCESIYYDTCDNFLMQCNHMPSPEEYSIFEKHMSDVPLRKITQWIKEKSK
ncbi:hypothetical protein GPJ56_003573 [Histomonas meleagridis]|uniref:uncharacterized protein n=1 Tax=Histomonas meleagridis TaxID=135588 RepID=UPI003559DB4E|nr:hypothetical protein GPJ56_003573 [Histomonas meleagridis]KAH0800643.1 hypothetical protein GO595_006396 [Histomonas meleagridis]